MRESYFWIESTEDGIAIYELSKSEVHEQIRERTVGVRAESLPRFLDALPNNMNYGGEHDVVLIRGAVVVPKPVQRVTEYEL